MPDASRFASQFDEHEEHHERHLHHHGKRDRRWPQRSIGARGRQHLVRHAHPDRDGRARRGPNPEQLFALGYAACFHSALKLIAGLDQSDVSDSEVSATVGFGQTPDGGFGLEVALDVSIPNLPPDQAQALVERAHEVCPYSNATRNNIEVALSVI